MNHRQLILADKYLPYEVTYEDCHVFNPGGFAGSDYTWSVCESARLRSDEMKLRNVWMMKTTRLRGRLNRGESVQINAYRMEADGSLSVASDLADRDDRLHAWSYCK